MKKLTIAVVAFLMLMMCACKSSENSQVYNSVMPFDWSQGTDLYTNERTEEHYLEYIVDNGTSNEFIHVYIYSEELYDKLVRLYYYDGEGIETINNEYCIVKTDDKYIMCGMQPSQVD